MARLSKTIEKWLTEIIIVVVGITIAFFVENYRSGLEDDARYRSHLLAIHKDLLQDSIRYSNYIAISDIRVHRIDSLYWLVEQKSSMRDKIILTAYLQGFEFYESHDNAFAAFKASENFAGMTNSGLRDSISNYYGGQSFLEFTHNEHFNWMRNGLFDFLDRNLHPADRKFDRYWHPADRFGTWSDEPPRYKSNLKEFSDIVILNYARRCRDFSFYTSGAIAYDVVLRNKALRNSILRELDQ